MQGAKFCSGSFCMAGVGRSYSDDEQNFSMLNLHFCGVQKNDEKGLRLGEIFVTMKLKVGKVFCVNKELTGGRDSVCFKVENQLVSSFKACVIKSLNPCEGTVFFQ